jgi:hypothetical protein
MSDASPATSGAPVGEVRDSVIRVNAWATACSPEPARPPLSRLSRQ